jgi:sterol desaturase/sphingolipid hydroxylase (fatty acid hydroxylase superfamily)
MEQYGKILLITMPIFVVLILIEILYGLSKGQKPRIVDMLSSLSSGMSNILKDVFGLTIRIVAYPFLLKYLSIFAMEKNVWTYIIAFISIDLSGYWYHRLTHSVNYFWNIHIIHHSSEEYNLPCALRQQFATFTNFTSLITIIPLAIMGVPYEVYLILAPIHLFAQFWYHTVYIKKMGFLEYFLVTPSHHRVHHAMNDIYMDKNFAQIFIFWDKIFGTFQQELDTVAPIYGVRRQVKSWNPFWINFQHLWLMIKDAFRTTHTWDKFRIWFMPTGWRPADVNEEYPIAYYHDGDVLHKYNPNYPPYYEIWGIIHITFNFLLLCFLFYQLGNISNSLSLEYAIFILVYIFGFTGALDKKLYGWLVHGIATFFMCYKIVLLKDWYGISAYNNSLSYLLAFTAIILLAWNTYFYIYYYRKESLAVSL